MWSGLGAAAAMRGYAVEPPASPAIHIGICTVGLDPAKAAGLDGVEIHAGGPAERLDITNPETRQRYHAQMKKTGLPVCSLMMTSFSPCPLATDPRAPAWLEQGIDSARDLGAKVILLAFFSEGDLLDDRGQLKESEFKEAANRIKQAAPRAKDAGVTLAIENYLNGEQNARMLDLIRHDSVGIYYDVFNTGTTKRHDVPADIRRLGTRIVQYHFKNGPKYLDEEPAKFEPIAAAIKAGGFRGWAVLETSSPSGDTVADARRNGTYLRKLLKPAPAH